VRERPKNRGSNKGGGIKEKKEELKEEEKEIKTWNIQKTTLKKIKVPLVEENKENKEMTVRS
jgi:hypothetical protein